MGIVAVSSMYTVEAGTIALYNNYLQSSHEMKAVNLYNEIWSNMEKSDVSQKIKSYRDLVSNPPATYQAGLLPKESQSVQLPSYLPTTENVEEEAQKLARKLKVY